MMFLIAVISIFNKLQVDFNNIRIMQETHYYEGKPFTGKVIKYYSNGKKEETYFCKNGIPEGEFVSWYKNGSIHEKGKYLGIRKLDVIGPSKKYNKTYYYKKREILISYYSNGKKESEGYYKNGELGGKQKSWYKNGNYYGHEEYKNGNLILSVFAMWKLRSYEEKVVLNEFLHNNNEKIQRTTYFSDYDNFSKNDIYKDGEVIEFWTKKDGISYPYKNKQKNKLLNHYKNSYGIPYVTKGMYWCYKRYDKYLDDFVKIFKEKAKNNVNYLDKKEIPVESYEVNHGLKKIFPLGDFYRSFSCKNDKCKIIYYMYSDIKKANKYWEFDLKLEGGYFFPIIYIFEREIDLKEKNNDKLKYMLSC